MAAQFASPQRSRTPEDEQPRSARRRPTAPLVVGHAEDMAERDAEASPPRPERDHAVHRAAAESTGAEVGYAGGPLSEELSGRIHRASGRGRALDPEVRSRMEQAFGADLSDVRVHDTHESATLSRSISASAFTWGRDIFFGAGQYRPDTAAGERILAHEIAHTRQPSAGVARTIHRRLAGTTEAAEKLGGGPTSGRARRIVKKLTNWDRILLGLREYETLEARLDGADTMAFTAAKPKMAKTLKGVESTVRSWHKDNNAAGEEARIQQRHVESTRKSRGGETDYDQSDTRSKAGRRQAVAMLEPRMANELRLLSGADPEAWMKSLGLNPNSVAGAGRTDAGQSNVVQEMRYHTPGGEFTGYFKQEKAFQAEPEVHESIAGIRQWDPHYGARTVAMYRLDQLLNANVTARAEFAIGQDQEGKAVFGTVLESAKGTSAEKLKVGLDRAHADQLGPGAVSLDDPVLQRCLNKLQILDAIAGQLDRHKGNYYVQQDDSGAVTGVTGIDLDMAFGGDMVSPNSADKAHNYKGLPSAIDKEMGEAILRIQPADIEAALTGLLTAKEVAATVTRFLAVQERVQEAAAAGALKETWDAASAQDRPGFDTIGGSTSRTTYTHDLALVAKFSVVDVASEIIQDVLRGKRDTRGRISRDVVEELADLDPRQLAAVENALVNGGFAQPVRLICKYLMDNNVPGEEYEEFVLSALGAWFDPRLWATAVVQSQSVPEGGSLSGAFTDVLTKPWTESGFATAVAGHNRRMRGRRRGIRMGGRR